MPSLELMLAFFAAAAVFAYIPGPSMMYATAQTLARGRRGGLIAALGLHAGCYVHVLAAAFGLVILFEAIPLAYTILKIVGAGYLVILGLRWLFVREKVSSEGTTPDESRAFWQSAIVEVLNPKTAVFFFAFLPQFTDPNAAFPLWAQLVILGTIVNVLFSSADLICVFLAAGITRLLQQSQRANRFIRRVSGAVLIALGVNLALSRA